MKRSLSEQKCRAYLQITRKRRKPTNMLLETEAGAGTLSNKVADVVDQIKPVLSSTVSEERRTTMTNLIKEIARFCFVYDADFRNVAEEHELIL